MPREYTFPREVTLIGVDDQTGDETPYVSFAEVNSVYAKETYQAMAVGLRPELTVTLPHADDDYHGEQRLVLDGVTYKIIRAFKTPEGMAELTVSRLRPGRSDSDTFLP